VATIGIFSELMTEPASAKESALPRSIGAARTSTLDRLASFRIVYVAIFIFAAVYVVSLDVAEILLQRHFETQIDEAVLVSPVDGPVLRQIQLRIDELLEASQWIRLGEVRVNVQVYGANGVTPLYLAGRALPPMMDFDPIASMKEAVRLLPATPSVQVAVPPTGTLAMAMLFGYGAILLTILVSYNRTITNRETRLLDAAVLARDASATRSQEIENELAEVQERLRKVEPTERSQSEEILTLQRERQGLREKLSDLAEREGKLRQSAARSIELDQERQALEDLLEEASEDLSSKEDEIQGLQTRLKSAAKAPPTGRARGVDQLTRRLRTLYKAIEFDDRAIQDLVALRDETMKLKAEEGIKRLDDESEQASIRRKVGGLPPQLSIFEMGFAGKGRIYYMRGKTLRYRVLLIGAKNSQKTDLDYLSRLSPN
jgi:hypothetical protein